METSKQEGKIYPQRYMLVETTFGEFPVCVVIEITHDTNTGKDILRIPPFEELSLVENIGVVIHDLREQLKRKEKKVFDLD